MRLLIAEDEVDLAEALTVFFERNQFTVDTVHDGLAACEYAAAAQYDAIILDVMMPKMDGIAVLQHLRRQGIKTPVMMLTAKAEKNDRITGFDSGADDYLPKPFEPDELISRVPGHAPPAGGLPAHGAYVRQCDAEHGHRRSVPRERLRAAQRPGISADGAVPGQPGTGAFGRPDHGAYLGLGCGCRNKCSLGPHFQPAEKAPVHRSQCDHPGQPGAGVHPGGRS